MNVLSLLKKNSWLLFLMMTFSAFSQSYEINITVNSRKDTIYLGHFFAKSDLTLLDDTAVLKKGKGVFKGNQKLAKGLYFIICDGKKFDIIIGDNQQFSMVADTADFIHLTKFTNSPENDVFFGFQRYHANVSRQAQQLNEQFKNASDDEKKEIRAKMQTITKERQEYIEKLIADNSDLYVSKFLRILIPPEAYMPEPPRDDEGNITDPAFQRRWFRRHFFDNLDIFDPDMLRTIFYEDKLLEFMTRVIPQHPDSICDEADKILTKAMENDEIFRCILVSLFNYYTKSELIVHINVKVHLAQQWYIPHSWWSTEDYVEQLKKFVEDNKILIGQVAPPIEMLMILPPEHFKAAAMDTAIKFDLHAGTMIMDFRKELPKKKFTVLFFWDVGCSHCKKAIHELFDVYEELKNDDWQVVTVMVTNERTAKGKWVDLVNENNYFGWINAWAPYTYKYKEVYVPVSFPQMYLLDEDNKILLKSIVPEQLKDIISNMLQ